MTIYMACIIHVSVQKAGAVKSNIGCCHHRHKGLACFCCHHFVHVNNVMAQPSCYGVFYLLIYFSRWQSFKASVVSSFKHLLLLCVHSLVPIHCCFVCNLAHVCCCLCVQVLEAKKGKNWHALSLTQVECIEFIIFFK